MESIFMHLQSIPTQSSSFINFTDVEMLITAFLIIICPTTWNLVARWEFHTKIFSKLAGDNKLAADIFAHVLIEMGILRNYMFSRAVRHQPCLEIPEEFQILTQVIAYTLICTGFLFIFMSFYRLGIHGIYYADYFGILMKEMVTVFPYNVLDNPLYFGSTLLFFGTSILYMSPSGFILSVLAWVMYKFASILENPMTDLIYSEENIQAVEKMNKEKEEKLRKIKEEQKSSKLM